VSARRPRKGQLSFDVPSLGERALPLTRQEVAKREIDTAIRLFVAGGDEVSIHVLGFAALGVLETEAKKTGRECSMMMARDHAKEEYADAFMDVLRDPSNYMKHGGADGTYERFNPAANELVLLFATADYQKLFGKVTQVMVAYLAFAAQKRPQLFPRTPFNDTLRTQLAAYERDFGPFSLAALAGVVARLPPEAPLTE
jgi:hypothetical protein